MSNVMCPECRKKISSYAEACPTCGFPMAKFLKEHNLTDFTKIWICPKCGYFDADKIKFVCCDYCNIPYIQTAKDNHAEYDEYYAIPKEERKSYIINLVQESGGDFSEKAWQYKENKMQEFMENHKPGSLINYSQEKEANQPHCPTCGSTNVHKISLTKKAAGAGLFGIFSKTARSQFECKDCGYKW